MFCSKFVAYLGILTPIMCSNKLYIFNPETDMSLGSGVKNYTPPQNIQSFVRNLALLPSLYAEHNSSILLPTNLSKLCASDKLYYNIVKAKNIELITDIDLSKHKYNIVPWGWDFSIANRLLRNKAISIDTHGNTLDLVTICNNRRQLSHRRLTIKFHEFLKQKFDNFEISSPLEFFSVEEASEWASNNYGCYLKAPWSSSGKGIFHLHKKNSHLLNSWLNGVIKRQGSVMAEIGEKRILDFATEWTISNEIVQYEGLSVFQTNENGNYVGNIIDSESNLYNIVSSHSNRWGNNIIESIKTALKIFIAPNYAGPLGVDMLITEDGRINPCVELNLRMTMGHVAISLYRQNCSDKIFIPSNKVNLSKI